jgi:hypothetical protein
MLYNPMTMPLTVAFPQLGNHEAPQTRNVGCRVVPARHMRHAMKTSKNHASPSYGQLKRRLPSPFRNRPNIAGCSFEHFVVNLLLRCKTGAIIDLEDDRSLAGVLYNRSGPIRAALAITIDAPEGFDWAIEPDEQ